MTLAELVNENAEGVRCWDAAKSDPSRWHRMTEDEYWYCLEVLPPIMFAGGFAVSEPIRGADPVFLAVVQVDGVSYCRELTRREMVPEAKKLRDNLKP